MASAYDSFLERLRTPATRFPSKSFGTAGGPYILDVMNALDEPSAENPSGPAGVGGAAGNIPGHSPTSPSTRGATPGVGGGGGGGLPSFGGGGGGAGFAGGAAGGGVPWYQTTWGQSLIKFGLGQLANKFLGGRTTEERNLSQYSTAGFGSPRIQRFLPLALQSQFTEPYLASGIQGIGDLLQRPGGLSGTVSEAILPRLASESEAIGQNFRGLRSEQAGAAARSNLPVSIKNALQSALGIGEERAQRELRRGALSESEDLRRSDLDQVYKLLDALLQFTSSGRGQAIQGLGAAAGQSGQRQASNMALVGSLIQSLVGSGRGQNDGGGVWV